MLKGLDPLLGPELLGILRAMGHGDELVISDANFPSVSIARRLVRADGQAYVNICKVGCTGREEYRCFTYGCR